MDRRSGVKAIAICGIPAGLGRASVVNLAAWGMTVFKLAAGGAFV